MQSDGIKAQLTGHHAEPEAPLPWEPAIRRFAAEHPDDDAFDQLTLATLPNLIARAMAAA